MTADGDSDAADDVTDAPDSDATDGITDDAPADPRVVSETDFECVTTERVLSVLSGGRRRELLEKRGVRRGVRR